MEVSTHDSSTNHYWLLSSLFLNIVANLDKTNITFVLGVIVSILAIINYVIQIKKNLKRKK
jgi:phosphatidylglycerophosphate synthase